MSVFSERDIIDFWLGDSVRGPVHAETQRELWYRGGDAVDEQIETRFGEQVALAREGGLPAWESTALGALALVILLDQFTRNMFRGDENAYCGDARALRVARRAVDGDLQSSLPVTGQIFLFHPFHHSESLADQNRAVALLEVLERECDSEWKAYVQRSIVGFGGHRDIVRRFGRFPHRNQVLGRQSTAGEQAFLTEGADHFGQSTGTATR